MPGASKLVAYRLKNAGINFKNIDFSVDRYLVDNYYGKNFNTTTQKYNPGIETTFDYLPSNNLGAIVARVKYAVTVPFTEINGKPLSYIRDRGGMDGDQFFSTGDTIVFYKQEGFVNAGTYDGWVRYTNAYLGDNITTAAIEGYDAEGYDTYTVVPGYIEKTQGISSQNQRGGIWTIQIVNDIVFLDFVMEIETNQRIQVIGGKNFKSSVLYYSPMLTVGQTVPTYKVYNVNKAAIGHPTTFNNGTTRFTSNRDQYYTPKTQDKYLKFPQNGAFK